MHCICPSCFSLNVTDRMIFVSKGLGKTLYFQYFLRNPYFGFGDHKKATVEFYCFDSGFQISFPMI